jgi:hypothetical protein
MKQPHLQYFDDDEFVNGHGDWWPMMSPRLLVLLDVLRFRLGRRISISNSDFALGRNLKDASDSEHNVDKWGEVLAADVFISGIYTTAEARSIVREATKIGFTGIGVYADTNNNYGSKQVMFHLGVRSTSSMGEPATWGRVNHDYCTINEAIANLPIGDIS